MHRKLEFYVISNIGNSYTVCAQTAITYEYDDTGNRISRRIAGKSNGFFMYSFTRLF